MYITSQILDKYFKDSVEKHSEKVPDDVWKQVEVNLKKKKAAYDESLNARVEAARKLKTNNKKGALRVKFTPALTNKLVEMDEIIKNAAEQYPLNTQNFDWGFIQKKLGVQSRYRVISRIRRLLIKCFTSNPIESFEER